MEWMFGLEDGFDVVIGNPPYVRQEKIKALKPALQSNIPAIPAWLICTSTLLKGATAG